MSGFVWLEAKPSEELEGSLMIVYHDSIFESLVIYDEKAQVHAHRSSFLAAAKFGRFPGPRQLAANSVFFWKVVKQSGI